jgi:hypothetical protein
MLFAVESLLEGSGKKAEAMSSIKDVQMLPNTIMRTEPISHNLSRQLMNDLRTCGFYLLQSDEPSGVAYTARLVVLIRLLVIIRETLSFSFERQTKRDYIIT